jgi:hypothetical protein
MHHGLARQMFRQGAPERLVYGRLILMLTCLTRCCSARLKIFEREFELRDLGIELLRGSAELQLLQPGKLNA